MSPSAAQENAHSALLVDVARVILEARTADAALSGRVFAMIRDVLDADVLFNYQLDDGVLRLKVGVGIPAEMWEAAQQLDLGQAFCGTAAALSEPLVADAVRVATDPRGAFVHAMGVRAYSCHPLLGRAGEVLGTFSVASTRRDEFSSGDTHFLQTLCHFLAIAWDRQRADDALLARERELQTLADNTPDILTRFDREFRHRFVNAAVERATGRPRTDFLGKTNRELGMPPDLCDKWETAQRYVFETGEHRSIEFAFETPSGLRHYLARMVPEFGPDGEVASMLGVTRDVTDARAADEALREADRRKDEFLAILAHELRNPLAPIRTGLHVMRLAPSDAHTAERARAMMERQVEHMVRLVDELLDVSRISRGKLVLRRERLEARVVCEHAVEASRPLLDACGHALALSLPEAALWVDGDLTRLAQVVSNLLHNAAKYTPPGGRVELAAWADGDRVALRVTDNGAGISAAMLPRVFDLFAQVDRTLDRAQGGLGIGLSLVRNIVEMHGGDVTAESPGLGRGSTFTVRLPRLASEASDEAPVVARIQPGAPGRRRILVVDDNEDGAEALTMMLGLLGHETAMAHDGPAALRAVGAFAPEVIFLDLGMPEMSGYEVARRLRSDPALKRAVLIALTGWGTERDKQQSRAAGFDFHLTKPVGLHEVEDVLARAAEIR